MVLVSIINSDNSKFRSMGRDIPPYSDESQRRQQHADNDVQDKRTLLRCCLYSASKLSQKDDRECNTNNKSTALGARPKRISHSNLEFCEPHTNRIKSARLVTPARALIVTRTFCKLINNQSFGLKMLCQKAMNEMHSGSTMCYCEGYKSCDHRRSRNC